MSSQFEHLRSVLATDCGSTTTKAILIEYNAEKDEYRLTARGEAPTTVEAPFEDVTKGVLNAALEVEELRGRKLLEGEQILSPQEGEVGVDAYISTSSAGGGLQVIVGGVVKSMSAESGVRAALGAGAIVMDTLASNDKRRAHEKIDVIRQLRPDMILLAGGIDHGTTRHVVALAELVKAARPRSRLGNTFNLPIIYAGNKEVKPQIEELLGEACSLHMVENVRPVLERENLGPAREMIHDLFMEHVMQQAPGYSKLMAMTHAPIVPTPGAVGYLIEAVARQENISVVGVDIGGATTDVFSVFKGIFNRTVSANLGMSYSVSNVLAEAGLANVLRWVPFDIEEVELRNRIGNKMIRPTTIPQTLDELKIEQAISREALRLAFVQHKAFAVELHGVQKERTISDAFEQDEAGKTLVDMMALNLIIGSGGVLSHAPRRAQSARMMIDAFLPEGITELAVDSIFMMPHLGVLATVNPRAANEVFQKDCLVRLGSCVAPVGKGKWGQPVLDVELTLPDGGSFRETLTYGSLKLIKVPYGPKVRAVLKPRRDFNMGAGPGVPLNADLNGGQVGIVLDCRGRRPFEIPADASERVRRLKQWAQALDEYPAE
ncbi:MAG: glutamate mutase L [Myxococcota bacterium]